MHKKITSTWQSFTIKTAGRSSSCCFAASGFFRIPHFSVFVCPGARRTGKPCQSFSVFKTTESSEHSTGLAGIGAFIPIV